MADLKRKLSSRRVCVCAFSTMEVVAGIFKRILYKALHWGRVCWCLKVCSEIYLSIKVLLFFVFFFFFFFSRQQLCWCMLIPPLSPIGFSPPCSSLPSILTRPLLQFTASACYQLLRCCLPSCSHCALPLSHFPAGCCHSAQLSPQSLQPAEPTSWPPSAQLRRPSISGHK